MANDLYRSYFSHRGCDSASYQGCKLPAYFIDIVPRDKDARILDIGCGFGQVLSALKAMGYRNLTGVDLSLEAVAHCQKQGLDVQQIQSLEEYSREIAGRPYDLVIMSHVLEHIEKHKIIPTLRLVRDVFLKEGGRLLVMVPNAQSNTGSYWAYEDFTHHTLFTAGSLAFCLKSAGFEEIDFLDPQGLEGNSFVTRVVKAVLLKVYEMNYAFWNKVTSSSFHQPSLRIFTYELKALAHSR